MAIPLSMFAPHQPGALPSQLPGIRSRLAEMTEIRKQRALPGFQQAIQQQFASGQPDKMQMLSALAAYDPQAAMETQFGGAGPGGAQMKWQYDIEKNRQAGEIKRKIAEKLTEFRAAQASGDEAEQNRIRGEIELLEADLLGIGVKERVPVTSRAFSEEMKKLTFEDKQEEDDYRAFRGIRDKLAAVHSQFTQAIQRYVDKYLVALNAMKQLQADSQVVAQAKAGNRTSQELLLNFINKLVDPSSAVLEGEARRFAPGDLGKDFEELKRYLTVGAGRRLESGEVQQLVSAANAVGQDLYSTLNAMTDGYQKAYNDQKKMLVLDPSPGVKQLIEQEGLMDVLNRPLASPPRISFSGASVSGSTGGTGGIVPSGGVGGTTTGGLKVPGSK